MGGDSDFERQGTIMSTNKYMEERDIKRLGTSPVGQATIAGHEHRVRTKTFKMLDEPMVEELIVELKLLNQWVEKIVSLDDGLDVELENLDDARNISEIEDALRIDC